MTNIENLERDLRIVEKSNGLVLYLDGAGELFAVLPPAFEREEMSAQHRLWSDALDEIAIGDDGAMLTHLLAHPAPASSETCRVLAEYLDLRELLIRRVRPNYVPRELPSVQLAKITEGPACRRGQLRLV